MSSISPRLATAWTAALLVAACGGMPSNRSLDSVHRPVIEQQSYAIDLAAGPDGLPYPEQQRLARWLEALAAGHGDRATIDDRGAGPAARATVAELAAARGVTLADDAPGTAGDLTPGLVRVTLTRAHALVPACPDWSAKSDVNLTNGTASNYGCAINGNLAAMVADPEDLVRGVADPGTTVTMTATKAIASYREAPPTGTQGLRPLSTSGDSGGGGGTGQ